MNTPSIVERLVEEFKEKFSLVRPGGRRDHLTRSMNSVSVLNMEIDWLRSALSQARQEGREEVVEYINHNLMWGRDSKGNLVMDSKHVTEVLQAALTTEGK